MQGPWKVDTNTALHTKAGVEYCACDVDDLLSTQSLPQIQEQDSNIAHLAFLPANGTKRNPVSALFESPQPQEI